MWRIGIAGLGLAVAACSNSSPVGLSETQRAEVQKIVESSVENQSGLIASQAEQIRALERKIDSLSLPTTPQKTSTADSSHPHAAASDAFEARGAAILGAMSPSDRAQVQDAWEGH